MVLGAGRGFCMVNVGRANGGLLRGIEDGLLSLARVGAIAVHHRGGGTTVAGWSIRCGR